MASPLATAAMSSGVLRRRTSKMSTSRRRETEKQQQPRRVMALSSSDAERNFLLRPILNPFVGNIVHAEESVTASLDNVGKDTGASTEDEKPELIKQADAAARDREERIRKPAQFQDQFLEVRNLTSVHAFEGFRLDITKMVTPTFYTTHAAFFGSPQFPKGYYQGVLTVVGEGDKLIRATMDHDCNVNADVHVPMGSLLGKLSLQVGKNDNITGTAAYSGESFTSQVVLGPGQLGVGYNQAITPRLSVGGDGQFSSSQQAVGLQYGFKYSAPEWAFLGSFIGGGANVVVAQYLRRVVPGRVALGCEYQLNLANPSMNQTSVGAEFSLRQSKVSASLDSDGKVNSTLEVKLPTFLPIMPMTFTMSSSLDHAQDKASFGVGLQFGQ